MNKVLTHSEYQSRMQGIRTPEDAAAFAQELLASTIAGLSKDEPEVVEEPQVRRKRMGKRLSAADIVSRQTPGVSPWYEVASNEKEAILVMLVIAVIIIPATAFLVQGTAYLWVFTGWLIIYGIVEAYLRSKKDDTGQ